MDADSSTYPSDWCSLAKYQIGAVPFTGVGYEIMTLEKLTVRLSNFSSNIFREYTVKLDRLMTKNYFWTWVY